MFCVILVYILFHVGYLLFLFETMSHLSEILVNILSRDNSYLFWGPNESGCVLFWSNWFFSIKDIMILFQIASHCNGLIQLQYIYHTSFITYSTSISFYVFLKPTISCEEEYRLNLPQVCSLLNLVRFQPELEPVLRWPRSATNYTIFLNKLQKIIVTFWQGWTEMPKA